MSVEITEDDTIKTDLFGWCSIGDHQGCKRIYRRFLTDPRTNKIQWLNEVYQCSCTKRGCKCYIKPADRVKPAAKKTRRKK